MGSVTYKNQPAINKTKGNVPLAGTSHIYRVKKKLWNDSIEDVLQGLFIGRTLHVCCGKSLLGDVRLDADAINIVIEKLEVQPFIDEVVEEQVCHYEAVS